MSRIGKLPVKVPSDVSIEVVKNNVKVSKGVLSLEQEINPGISIDFNKEAGVLQLARANNSKPLRALHGLYRSLLNNMIIGLTKGFQRQLNIVGVGFRAELKEKRLHLQLGYSHAIVFMPPEGIELVVENPTTITVKGHNKQLVGQIAAKIRSFRPPEPYKGKGIKYSDEVIRRKAGKAAGK